MAKDVPITHAFAEKLAIQALSFIAGDPDRLGHFLAITGIGPEMIRAAATDPGFLAGVLDHVISDEPLLIAVAEYAGVRPQELERAQSVLGGQPWKGEVP
jgi:hypothetical protein